LGTGGWPSVNLTKTDAPDLKSRRVYHSVNWEFEKLYRRQVIRSKPVGREIEN